MAAAALLPLASGCTSTGMAMSEVRLPSHLDRQCVEAHLRGEKDVVDFRAMPAGEGSGWWFELADPTLMGKEMPSILASQQDQGNGPIVELQATWMTSQGNADTVRAALLRREQEILSRLLDRCADSDVRFGSPGPCGKGEDEDSLCVQGTAHAR